MTTMNHEHALHLLATFCTMPSRISRHAVTENLQHARIARHNWIASRGNWYYQDRYQARHAWHIDLARIHRRAAELVAQYGQRCDSNAYPVTL